MSEPAYRDTQYSRMLIALGGFLVFGIGIAVGAVFGDAVRVITWGSGALLAVWATVRTRLDVTVTAQGIRVSRAALDWSFVERIEVLEGDSMRAATGREAHPRDYLRLRNTRAGVRVWLDDATDPHRAWLVSVRDPRQLHETLSALGKVAAS